MSVYQENGRPLSQQALYQQKLRLGVYNSPGRPIVGVNSNAPDAAALLAASADLTVRPSYERLHVAPDAQTAAAAAKKQSVAAWSRGHTDPSADAAAASALDHPHGSAAAAASAAELGVPEYNRGAVYRAAAGNSTMSMTSRVTPAKAAARHGLATRSNTITAASLDLGRISQAADRNSSQLLNDRFNPAQDYRSGLVTSGLSAADERLAAQSAGRSLTMKHGSGYLDSISQQKRTKTFQAADVVDATLLAAASRKANERLNAIALTEPADLRDQAQIYAKALAAAQRNLEQRIAAHKSGMIDMGGGLQMPYAEIDKLAALVVQPVLADLGAKADAQREVDAQQRSKHAELLRLHQKFKIDEFNRRTAEKAQRKTEERERVAANEERKVVEDGKYSEYQEERHAEVAARAAEFTALEEKLAGEREELEAEAQANSDRIDAEATELAAARKAELDEMQAERDEELRPTLDELATESGKLQELTDRKNELQAEVDAGEELKRQHEETLADLRAKLEATATETTETSAALEEATGQRETADKEVEELQATHSSEANAAEEAHRDLDAQLEQLEHEKEENLATKAAHKTAIMLELDDRVKDEHKINKELPSHMQMEVDDSRLRDTGSLFSADEAALKKEVAPAKTEEGPVEKKEEVPVVKAAAPVKKVDPAAPKKGFRSRFTSLKSAFKTPTKEPTAVALAAPAAAPAVKRKSVEASNYDEDISIKDDRSKQGGLFKEEI